MARAVPLFSGSRGNSYYIGTSGEGVLIDAGRSCKQIERALEANGVGIKSISGVFITHEHTDHCSGIRVLAKKYGFDVYASAGTLGALERTNKIDPKTNTYVIEKRVAIGNMLVERIDTPHDAAESCCYRVISGDGKSALIATDMGYMTDEIRNCAKNSDFVVIESNHDIEMLKNGIYPLALKRRILSDKGHLSNEACSSELAELVKSGAMRLMLGHLSEHNNTPALALSTAAAALEREGLRRGVDCTLDVAPAEAGVKSVIF